MLLERGTNDWDIEMVFASQPRDRVRRDQMMKRILKGDILNHTTMCKEKQVKETYRYVPEGVSLMPALGEVCRNTQTSLR